MGAVTELLDNPAIRIGIAVVLLGIVAHVARKLLARPKRSPYHVRVRCRDCGWTGLVGKFNRRCNACASLAVTTLEE
jgi:hypothetical protein